MLPRALQRSACKLANTLNEPTNRREATLYEHSTNYPSVLEALFYLGLFLSIFSWVWQHGANDGLEAVSRRGVPSNAHLRDAERDYRRATLALRLSLLATLVSVALLVTCNVWP